MGLIRSNSIRHFALGIIVFSEINYFFWQNWIVDFCLAVMGVYFGIRYFFWSRKELALADLYVRTAQVRSPKQKKRDWFVLLMIIIGVGCFVYYVPNPTNHYAPIAIVGAFVIIIPHGYYENFNNSITAFSDGIKLPNRRQKVIAWQDIEAITINKNHVEMTFHGNIKSYFIDSRDEKDLSRLKEQWEVKRVIT